MNWRKKNRTKNKDWNIIIDVPDEIYQKWIDFLKKEYDMQHMGRFSTVRQYNTKMFIEKIIEEMEK